MATLRRNHAPVPWGAHVEQMVWARSKRGTPRRRRLDRPALTHDPGWNWDGVQILFTGKTTTLDEEEDVYGFQLDDEHSPSFSGRTHATLSVSLLDIAQYRVTKRCGKARPGLDDFEVIRVPKVVPISEEEPEPGDSWELGDWEKLDALGFKRTYSEVAQGYVRGKGPPDTLGLSQQALMRTEDDHWECL